MAKGYREASPYTNIVYSSITFSLMLIRPCVKYFQCIKFGKIMLILVEALITLQAALITTSKIRLNDI